MHTQHLLGVQVNSPLLSISIPLIMPGQAVANCCLGLLCSPRPKTSQNLMCSNGNISGGFGCSQQCSYDLLPQKVNVNMDSVGVCIVVMLLKISTNVLGKWNNYWLVKLPCTIITSVLWSYVHVLPTQTMTLSPHTHCAAGLL